MHTNFSEFGISDQTVTALSSMGFEEPTPIQKIAIPPALRGKDIIGQAQTGTGKTAAFAIPIIESRPKEGSKLPYAIILCPTRELAVQVSQEINRIGSAKGVFALPVYGGQSIEVQLKNLRRGVDIIVGTPGRVIDHIRRKSLILKDIRIVVLDEADEMLNMGFIEDIETILREVPQERQTMLFSATMPAEVLNIARHYMDKPKHVRVDASAMVVTKIKQAFYEVREEDKIKALTRLVDVEGPSLTLIFCRTKKEVDDVSGQLRQMGYLAGALHGDFTQSHRDDMMRKFKKGDIDILVATDVAARGLDIPDVSHVINYSIPQDPEGYIHRIGRTGRAGKSGIAITFVTPREYRHLRLIEKAARTVIPKAKLPTKEEVRKARESVIAATLEETMRGGEHADYYPLVGRLLETHSPEEVTAAALSLLFGKTEVEDISEVSMAHPYAKKDFIRLFMTVGKKDNLNVGDIVKSISSEAGIPSGKIGNIVLFDTFSFVEVPPNLADRVIASINNRMMKGRKVKIQRAKKTDRKKR
ncbi:MAG: DEAD/DEAH box helicase [Nitrospirota bacterium]